MSALAGGACSAPSRLLWVWVLALATLFGRHVSAETRIEALVIGNNRPPLTAVEANSESELPALRFADDDAAAFYEFIMGVASNGRLLTLMDRDTQALYPKLVSVARAPTLAQVKGAVAEIRAHLEQHKQAGHRSVVFVFFSGHGSVDAAGTPELALADGGITQKVLYEEILARLPADVVHLMVDACHAEAVVRPRDTEARTVSVTASEANAVLVQSTLARYPSVGAILAAASDGQSHEWDQLRQGVFTHELLSALRGGADVNGDGRLEYSEVFAFLSAANRGVDDPRARLAVVARPPDSDRRAPIVEFATFAKSAQARLTAIPARPGSVQVDDDSGRHLVTVRAEPGFVVNLLLPSERTIYLRAGEREAQFRASPGQSVPYESLRFVAAVSRARGSVDAAVRRGLFATEFGRGYYSGFIDRAPEFVPVALPPTPRDGGVETAPDVKRANDEATRRFVLGLGMSNAVANQLAASGGLRVGLRPNDSSGAMVSLDVLYASTEALTEWRSQASVGWLWGAKVGAISGVLGLSAGGGVILQDPDARSRRASFVGNLAPLLGMSVHFDGQFRLWSEAELPLLFYRRDAALAASFAPALWAGGSLGF